MCPKFEQKLDYFIGATTLSKKRDYTVMLSRNFVIMLNVTVPSYSTQSMLSFLFT